MTPKPERPGINVQTSQAVDPPAEDSQEIHCEARGLLAEPMNPWVSIWSQPRATIQQIVENNPTARINELASLGGISQALMRAHSQSRGDEAPWILVVVTAVGAGAIAGMFGLYISAALLRWTGKWIGGRASAVTIRAALAWANVPHAYIIILMALQLVFLREEMFTSRTPRLDGSLGLQVIVAAAGVTAVVIWIWHFVIMLKCVGQVQHFSAWMALVNWLLVATTVGLPVIVVVLLGKVLGG